jgi:hypothetical protein
MTISANRLPEAFAATLLAGLAVGAVDPAAVQAQTGPRFSCVTGTLTAANTSDTRPVPRILRYAVAPGTDPTPVGGLRETRAAEVTGGDATRGWLRIDVQFDSALPRDCALPLLLTVASDRGSAGDLAVSNRLADILDGFELIAGRPQTMPHLAGAIRFSGSGTDTASFRIPIRATSSGRVASHGLKLVLALDYAGGLPLTVNVAPLPAFSVIAPAAPVAAGTTANFRADHPVALLPGTAAMPVTFAMSSQSLGRWLSPNPARPTEVSGGWDTRFTPLRAEAALVAAVQPQASNGTVTVSFAGRTQTVPVTIAAAPATAAPACDPVFAVTAVPGGLRLSMSNSGAGSCPGYRVTPRIFSKLAAPLKPVQATLSPATGLKPVTGAATPAISTTFTFDKAALAQLKPGTRFDFDLTPDGAKAAAETQRVGITLKDADLVTISGKPLR